MHALLVAALLQLAAAIVVAAAAAASVALPGCESKCGDVHVPYPFGTTAGCYWPGFKVTCRRSAGGNDCHRHARPPKLLLGSRSDGPQVLEISVPNGTVRVSSTVWFFDVGDARTARLDVVPHDGGPFVLSAAGNRLVHIGCGFRVASWAAAPSSQRAGGGGARAHSACSSSCSAEHLERQRTSRRRCDGLGLGCCDAPVPAGGLTSFAVRFEWNGTGGGGSSGSPWIASEASVAAVEQEWWSRKDNLFTLKMSLLALGRASEVVVPVVLDWAFDNSSTCAEAAARPDFGCASKHSECLNSTGSAYGYVCRCRHGYEGNPYVKDGCTSPRGPSSSFICYVHSRYLLGLGKTSGTIFAMGLGIGIFLLLLVLATVFATKSLKDDKAKKMKEHIAERMIFSLEELEKATNKFDKARILGGAWHGMVYKGITSDQHVVAIKRFKLVIQREIDAFEVAILSQINHRNVVKLFGCCLEIEVPLLLYEFIPNGTLYAHLQVDGPLSLPWQDRLRIAFELWCRTLELLTRKKPTIDMSPDGISLVAHFIHLLSDDRLGDIMDVQVIEEGGNEVKQVAAMAALCLQMKGDDRPTMRHVEMGLQSSSVSQ
ncbi:hypothetical protein GQ55_6G244100 [Panicum hallii var. hallii]|uniref:Protein kinase domain-containing protein n=1 Tax=Panicum hallii var. hallii TaxID=1504633 RepID=A0A2T7D934_9POAL|nr:hypothetical protein GQ55_6G244100 [Panicum hallii var. hallii]